MNETLSTIQTRYSCRSFTGIAPTEEQLDAILKAATQAPSSVNRQRWQIIAVRNQSLISQIEAEGIAALANLSDKSMFERIRERGGKLFYNAPCVVFIAIDSVDPVGTALDCGIVCQNITLAAQSLGLGSCICGLARFAFSGDKNAYFKEKLHFPTGYEFGMAILLGEAAAPASPHEPNMQKTTVIK